MSRYGEVEGLEKDDLDFRYWKNRRKEIGYMILMEKVLPVHDSWMW